MSNDTCRYCGKPYKSENSIACSWCGKPRIREQKNTCENPSCQGYGKQLEENEYYCDLCTKPTTIGKEVEKALGH